jgi:hypothetical protein
MEDSMKEKEKKEIGNGVKIILGIIVLVWVGFIVYDLKNNKEIISLKSNPDIFDYFMRVSDNGKTYFYN